MISGSFTALKYFSLSRASLTGGENVAEHFSMHDYSRDIMLANAQTDMEANLAKMQLNKKIALTKSNEDKAAVLKKQNDELGYMFLPTQVSVEILQGKPIEELTQKIERATLLDIEVHGSSEFCA